MEPLIESVRKYPCLWNTAAIEYRDQELRDAAWAEVMRDTHLGSVKEVKLKWKKLRDSYRDALKRHSDVVAREASGAAGGGANGGGGATGGGGKRPYPWKYMAHMNFLQPYMSNRKRPLEVPPPASSSESEGEGRSGAEPDPLDTFFAGMCQSTKRLPLPAQLKVKRVLFEAVAEAEEALLASRHDTDKPP